MSNYTNQNNVENYIGESLPAGLTTYIAKYLNAIDNWIENYTNRTFKDIASATKTYDSDGGRVLYIDNFEGSPTEVKTLDGDGDDDVSLTEDEDYRTFPQNETIKTHLILMEGGSLGAWPSGEKRVSITANFGVTTIPADIELAATKLLASILAKYTKGGETKSEKVGDVQFSFKDIDEAAGAMGIYNILDQYRHPTI